MLSTCNFSGVVRRAASRPISIIRSTSVPAQLQDRSQAAAPGAGGGSGGNATTTRRGMHNRDRSLQHDFRSGAAAGFGGIAQSLPIPQAPLLAGSLPPSRFLDDLPPLSLGPQVKYHYCRTYVKSAVGWNRCGSLLVPYCWLIRFFFVVAFLPPYDSNVGGQWSQERVHPPSPRFIS